MESSTVALTTVTLVQLMLAQKMERLSAHAITRFLLNSKLYSIQSNQLVIRIKDNLN